jgi:chemotaxis protein methyltransferase CheR
MIDTEFSARMSEKDFNRLSGFIHSECGIRIPLSKKPMLVARLQKRLRALRMRSFDEYCDYLFSPNGLRQELIHMIDVVTTNKTDFFREPRHFDYLTQTALPELMNGNGTRRLKVWSAGCSTGEEPYTLAMVLEEFAERCPGLSFSILATDISTRVLETARCGIYQKDRAEPVSPVLKRKYFMRSRDRSKGLVRVVPELRARVEFRRVNFLDGDYGIRSRCTLSSAGTS